MQTTLSNLKRCRASSFNFSTVIHSHNISTQCVSSLQDLYAIQEPKQTGFKDRNVILQKALNIYNSIDGPKDAQTVSTFTKLCFDYRHTDKIHLIWRDIEQLQLISIVDKTNGINFPYSLLFKYAIKSNEIKKCIQLLQWIDINDDRMNINDSFITKFIVKCINISHLQLIDKLLINKQIICEKYQYINTSLINAFGKYHNIDAAIRIFDKISNDDKDIFMIGAMMKAFINNKYFKQTLDLYENCTIEMDDICHCMAIKACSKIKDYDKGLEIYAKIKNPNIEIKTAVIDLYGNAKQMNKAMDIFRACDPNQLNIITFNAIMTGYINNGLYKQALEIYDQIQVFNKKKTEISYILAIRACSNSNNYRKGKELHNEIAMLSKNDTKQHIAIKTALIEFYGKLGNIQVIKKLFNSIPEYKRDIICVGTTMTVFTNNGFDKECIELYDNLNINKRDPAIYNIAIKACGNLMDYEKGKEIHNEIINKKCINLQLKHTLIDFYGHCKEIEIAEKLYQSIMDIADETNAVTINVMMTAYLNNGYYDKAVELYDYDAFASIKDAISHCLGIKTCIKTGDHNKGRMIHQLLKNENSDHLYLPELQHVLMDFYGCFKDVAAAENIFNSIQDNKKTIITFGTMINVYIDNKLDEKALELYHKMEDYDLTPNNVCNSLAIKACAHLNDMERGKYIHEKIGTDNINDTQIGTALIDLYGKCGDMRSAQYVFDSIKSENKDIICINALLNGYHKNGFNQKCIEIFQCLSNDFNLKPVSNTFVIVLNTCIDGDYIEYGQNVHQQLILNKAILNDQRVQLTLINMYGKFGMIEKCEQLFEEIIQTEMVKDIAIWNGMIHSYIKNNKMAQSKKLFDDMRYQFGLIPDKITYIILLTGYSHSGCIKDGIHLLRNINIETDIMDYDQHIISSIIDGLSRRGLLFEAFEFIKEFQSKTKTYESAMWMSLLSGCNMYNNKLLGQFAFDTIKTRWIDQQDVMTAAKTLIINIYHDHNIKF